MTSGSSTPDSGYTEYEIRVLSIQHDSHTLDGSNGIHKLNRGEVKEIEQKRTHLTFCPFKPM